jgi:steroid delta-isomerase-like uncharacterized protein
MIKLQRILKLRTALNQSMGTVEEQNKQLVRQFFDAFDRQDTEVMDQLVSSTSYSLHFLGTPPTDWNGTKQFSAAFYIAFPDLHHNIVDMVAEGEDKVAVRLNVTGTHKGEFQGIPPTGKKVSFNATDFVTLQDGKIVEERVNADTMGLMQQIGAIPSAPPSGASDGSNTALS